MQGRGGAEVTGLQGYKAGAAGTERCGAAELMQGFRTQRCRDAELVGTSGLEGTQGCRDAETWRCRGDRDAGIQSWGCRDTGLEGTQGCRDIEMWGCRADAGIQDTEMQGSGAAGMQSWWGHRDRGTPGCGDTGMEGPMGADQAGTQRHGDTETRGHRAAQRWGRRACRDAERGRHLQLRPGRTHGGSCAHSPTPPSPHPGPSRAHGALIPPSPRAPIGVAAAHGDAPPSPSPADGCADRP